MTNEHYTFFVYVSVFMYMQYCKHCLAAAYILTFSKSRAARVDKVPLISRALHLFTIGVHVYYVLLPVRWLHSPVEEKHSFSYL